MHIETAERTVALQFTSATELVAAGGNGSLYRYSTDGKQLSVHTIGRKGMGARFSPDGKMAVTAYGETKFEFFSTADGKKVGESPQLTGGPRGTTFSPDGKEFVYATTDGMLHSWTIATGKMNWKIKAGLGEAWGLVYSPDGAHLFAANADANIRMHAVRNGELEAMNESLPVSLFSAVYSPDGKTLYAGGAARQVHVFAAQGLKLERTFRRETDVISALAIGGDGKFLAATQFEELSHRNPSRITLYELPSGKVIQEILTKYSANAVSLSPSSRTLAYSVAPTGLEVVEF